MVIPEGGNVQSKRDNEVTDLKLWQDDNPPQLNRHILLQSKRQSNFTCEFVLLRGSRIVRIIISRSRIDGV